MKRESTVKGRICLYGEVYAVEPLGREYIVTISINAKLLKAIVSRDQVFTSGEKIVVCPLEEKIVLFDVRTERAIELLI